MSADVLVQVLEQVQRPVLVQLVLHHVVQPAARTTGLEQQLQSQVEARVLGEVEAQSRPEHENLSSKVCLVLCASSGVNCSRRYLVFG